jgi:hypothetical protein
MAIKTTAKPLEEVITNQLRNAAREAVYAHAGQFGWMSDEDMKASLIDSLFSTALIDITVSCQYPTHFESPAHMVQEIIDKLIETEVPRIIKIYLA